MNSDHRKGKKHTIHSEIPSSSLRRKQFEVIYLTGCIPMRAGSVPPISSGEPPKRNVSPIKSPSSMKPLPFPSSNPIMASSTLTTRYICRHCLEEHFHSFRLSWSMRLKISHLLTMPCLRKSSLSESLLLEIRGRAFTVFEEPWLMEWRVSKDVSRWKSLHSL